MAREVGLDAVVRPDVDQRAARRAESDLSDSLEPAAEMEPRFSGVRKAAQRLGDTLQSAMPPIPGASLLGGLSGALRRSGGGSAGGGGRQARKMTEHADTGNDILTAQLATQRSILKQLKKQGFDSATAPEEEGTGIGGRFLQLRGLQSVLGGSGGGMGGITSMLAAAAPALAIGGTAIGAGAWGMNDALGQAREDDRMEVFSPGEAFAQDMERLSGVGENIRSSLSDLPSLSDALNVGGVNTLATTLDMAGMDSLSTVLDTGAVGTLTDVLKTGTIPTIGSLLGIDRIPTLREMLGLGGGGQDRPSGSATGRGPRFDSSSAGDMGQGESLQGAIASEIGGVLDDALGDLDMEFNLEVANELELTFDPRELQREVDDIVGDVETEVDELKRRIERGGRR